MFPRKLHMAKFLSPQGTESVLMAIVTLLYQVTENNEGKKK
jgi:hypothetical protein